VPSFILFFFETDKVLNALHPGAGRFVYVAENLKSLEKVVLEKFE
jgi:hypothetical protein